MATCAFIFSLLMFTIFSPQDVVSEFRLASYFSDHMVLQMQPSSAVVWGYGTAGATVHISFGNFAYKTVVGEEVSPGGEGIWISTLDPQPAGGPHTITIEQDSSSIQIEDVYFGEVWFCSGQSNMEFEMYRVFDPEEELKKAQSYTELRFLKTPPSYDTVPHEDVTPLPEPWSGPNESTLSQFSALCWLYGEQLYDKLKVPIGLVQSTWGGTYVEAWSSPDALKKCGLEKKDLKLPVNPTDLLAPGPHNEPSVLWNAMVYPYLKMVIRGAIWYQGEANVDYNLHLYNCTFPNLITDWRVKWYEQSQEHTDETFPFGFMQLAAREESTSMTWPWLRWHQTLDRGFVPNPSMPNIFMAVGMDLTDDDAPAGPIHPRDKKTMAIRLGYSGLNVAYGQSDLPFKGPEVASIAVDETSAKMVYDQQVKLVGPTGFKYCCLTPMEACGEDTSTTDWLEPKLSQSDSTTINLETTCAPTNIVYAWKQRICDYKNCPVYADNEYSLPAAPWKWQITG